MPHINSSPQFNAVDCLAAHIFDVIRQSATCKQPFWHHLQGKWQARSFNEEKKSLIIDVSRIAADGSGLRRHTDNRRLPVISSCVHIRASNRNMVRNPPRPPPARLIPPLCRSDSNGSPPAAALCAAKMHPGKRSDVSTHLSAGPQRAGWGTRRRQSTGDPRQYRQPLLGDTASPPCGAQQRPDYSGKSRSAAAAPRGAEVQSVWDRESVGLRWRLGRGRGRRGEEREWEQNSHIP